jgi:UDP:flavonoid glycosyltransferase YjiC (YdhE family)
MESFQRVIDIGPIAEPASSAREQLITLLALSPGERTVLVGFGGIQLTSVPFETLESLSGYRFLFDGPVPQDSTRVISTKSLPFSFKALMASVDIIVTKPGYGTIVEAVALHTPVVYVRRYNFADEQSLVDYLHRYGRGIELSIDDFASGHWGKALQRVRSLSAPPEPILPATGASDAATQLAVYFTKTRA